MSWIAAGAAVVGLGVSVYKTVDAKNKEKKAAAAQARLTKPFYEIQDEYYKNRQLAEGMAGQGFTSGTQNYLTEESGRGFATGLSTISSIGGNPNDVAKLYSVYQNSLRNNAAADSMQQIENIKALMNVNREIAGQKSTKWSLDEDREYQTKLKELKMTQQIANQNMWNGISEGVSSVGAFGTAVSNNNLIPRGTNSAANGGRAADYSASGSVPLIESNSGGGNLTLQNRTSPNVLTENQIGNLTLQNRVSPDVNPAMLDNSYMGGGGGYYPGSADNDWNFLFGNNYQ